MDPLSLATSVLAVADSSFKVIEYLRTIKDGGKERQKLIDETLSLWKTLQSLYDDFPHELSAEIRVNQQELWARPVKSLAQPGGILNQIADLMGELAAKLQGSQTKKYMPSSGVKMIQSMKWPFEKKEADSAVARLSRLQEQITLHLTQATLNLQKQTQGGVSEVKTLLSNHISEQKKTKIVDWISRLDARQTQHFYRDLAIENTGRWFFKGYKFQDWSNYDRDATVGEENERPETTVGGEPEMKDLSLVQAAKLDDNDDKGDEVKDGSDMDTQDEKIFDTDTEVNSDKSDTKVSDAAEGATGELEEWDEDVLDQRYDLINSMLWCFGIPGTGKTVLASVTADFLRRTFNDEDTAILYAYCTFDDPNSHSAKAIIAALLRQIVLAHDGVSENVLKLFETHQSTKQEKLPGIDALCDALDNELSRFEKRFVIIDGLDELPDQKEREELLDRLQQMKISKPNIMVTSRPLPNIEALYGGPMDQRYCNNCEAIGMQIYYTCQLCNYDACSDCFAKSATCPDENHELLKQYHCHRVRVAAQPEDIENYVKLRVHKSASLESFVKRRKSLMTKILGRIKDEAHGMFLLAKFHMDELADQLSISEVEAALENLPHGIGGTYDQLMLRIEKLTEQRQKRVKNFIAWIAYAERPLTISEIEHAVTVKTNDLDLNEDDIPSAKELASLCGGMVVVDEIGRIRLAHETANDYVKSDETARFSNPNDTIATSCLAYLSLQPFISGACTGQREEEQFEKRIAKYPFLQYAALYWGYHVQKSTRRDLITQSTEMLRNEGLLQSAVQVMWYTKDTRDSRSWEAKSDVNALHVASYFGLDEVVSTLLGYGTDVDIEDCYGTTPLMLAASRGNASVVEVLLHAGARADLTSDHGATALHRAVIGGNTSIVSRLLSQRDIGINRVFKYSRHRTPLMIAACMGNVSIVKLLLERPDIDVNQVATGRASEDTALMFASSYGHVDVVKALLEREDLDINAQGPSGYTALIYASIIGYRNIVKLLLDAKADPDIRDNLGGRAFLRACDEDRQDVIRLFIDRGINYTFKDNLGRNVLHGCAINDKTTLLRLLLDRCKDLNVNQQGDRGETPLHDAAERGSMETVRALLDHGARTDIRNNAGQTPVRVARDLQRIKVLNLLRQFREQEQQTLQDYEEVTPPSMDDESLPSKDVPSPGLRKADTFAADYEPPLYTAVCYQPLHVIQAKIWPKNAKTHNHGAKGGRKSEDNDENVDGQTRSYHINVNDADPASGSTPLHNAVMYGRLEVIKILLDAEADVNARAHYGQTPLHMVTWATSNQLHLARVLLDHGADIDAEDKLGRTMLDFCSGEFRDQDTMQIAMMLIERNAKISPDSENLLSTLQWATYLGSMDVVKRLVGMGVPFQMQDDRGYTPYQRAKENGHEEIATYLFNLSSAKTRVTEYPESSKSTPTLIAGHVLSQLEEKNNTSQITEVRESTKTIVPPRPVGKTAESSLPDQEEPRTAHPEATTIPIPFSTTVPFQGSLPTPSPIQTPVSIKHESRFMVFTPSSQREVILVSIIFALCAIIVAMLLK